MLQEHCIEEITSISALTTPNSRIGHRAPPRPRSNELKEVRTNPGELMEVMGVATVQFREYSHRSIAVPGQMTPRTLNTRLLPLSTFIPRLPPYLFLRQSL